MMYSEEEKKRTIREWLKNYYNEQKGLNLNDKELNERFVQWCLNNNHQNLVTAS